jgi:hypothetical protein
MKENPNDPANVTIDGQKVKYEDFIRGSVSGSYSITGIIDHASGTFDPRGGALVSGGGATIDWSERWVAGDGKPDKDGNVFAGTLTAQARITLGQSGGGGVIPKIDQVGAISQENYSRIYNQLYSFVNNADCVKAFKDHLGTDLVHMLTAEGNFIRVGGFGIFTNDIIQNTKTSLTRLGLSYEGAGFVNRTLGRALYEANAWTIGGYKPHLVSGSRPTILLHNAALRRGSAHLAYTLLHELIHAAGWLSSRPHPTGLQSGFGIGFYPGVKQHDLYHVPGYDDILGKCGQRAVDEDIRANSQ